MESLMRSPPPPLMGYDHAIKTQEEFDAMISQSDWGGGHSVLLVGDGGNFKFTCGKQLLVPDNIKIIDGENSAAILFKLAQSTLVSIGIDPKVSAITRTSEITDTRISCLNFEITFTEDIAVPSSFYGIRKFEKLISCNISIDVVDIKRSSSSWFYGFSGCNKMYGCRSITKGGFNIPFHGCKKMYNCIGDSSSTYDHSGHSYAFYNCSDLVGCEGIARIERATGIYGTGFYKCSKLVNCIGTGICDDCATATNIAFAGHGMRDCTDIVNCHGIGNHTGGNDPDASIGGSGYGFYYCSRLSNCIGQGITTPSGQGGYAYAGCSYLNGCSNDTSTKGCLTSTNTKVDTLTCDS